MFEFYEQLRQRTGVIIFGASGSGKSTLWKLLEKALAFAGNIIEIFTINAKSMLRTKVFKNI